MPVLAEMATGEETAGQSCSVAEVPEGSDEAAWEFAENEGLQFGLAGPQVGVCRRIFVCNPKIPFDRS